MNNNENNDFICDILNSQKPDKQVLSSAKSIMVKSKPIQLRIKKQFYALSGCAAVFMIAGIIFAALYQIHLYNYEGNSLNVSESNQNSNNNFLIIALTLITIGVLLAITAIIIRAKKIYKIR